MSDPSTRKTKKAPAPQWRGMLADHHQIVRWAVIAILAAACISISFTSLGYATVTSPNAMDVHLVMLLPLVALGALLFGLKGGFLTGLFSGLVMFAHAKIMPLDAFELSFITPITSVVMMTVSGILLGVLLKLALRRNPPLVKRIIRIALICLLVALVHTILCMVSLVVQFAIETFPAAAAGTNTADAENFTTTVIYRALVRMGDPIMQAVFEAEMMAGACILVDIVSRRTVGFEKGLGLRHLFGLGLAAVFAIVYMLTAALSFMGITAQKYQQANNDMSSEVSFIIDQIEISEKRKAITDALLEGHGLTFDDMTLDEWEGYLYIISPNSTLSGYDEAVDGIIILSDEEGAIHYSDSPRAAEVGQLDQLLDRQALDAIERSKETNTLQRIVFDDTGYASIGISLNSTGSQARSYIAYLLSGEYNGFTVTIIRDTRLVFVDRWSMMLSTAVSSFVMLGAVFALTFQLLDRIVVRRLVETNAVLGRVQDGDLDAQVEITDSKELSELAGGINATVSALKGWIAEAESRLDSELALAKSIQESALPSSFPAYPDITAFDIYARMDAAREVGGDFYDFFLIGEEEVEESGSPKLGFIVADVSGKGIPAALFMMEAKSQVKSHLSNVRDLGEAIARANRQVCEGNDAGMFVTAWIGVLDYETGHIEFVNAGHNPPLIRHDGAWAWERRRSGVPLGLFDGMTYRAHSLDLEPGDELLLYTDGVTEAMDAKGGLFGEAQLEELVNGTADPDPEELVDAVTGSVARHADGAEQSDDITVLALKLGN